jgi:phytoene desaturase
LRCVVIGGGLGGLSAALDLNRLGHDVTLCERNNALGGKASERFEQGFRWDEGPSIVVMIWVYRELLAASGFDPDALLPMRRLDPAFRVTLAGGQSLLLPASESDLADTLATLHPQDGAGLSRFLAKLDRFAAWIGRAYCDRIYQNWAQVLFSPLVSSALVVSPRQSYETFIHQYFQSPAVRELLMGFPTYSGFDPRNAPASLAIIPWTILREGVWYPENGGIAAIPRAIAHACRVKGVALRLSTEVEAIELDSTGSVRGVATSGGFLPADVVISNADYVLTHRLLRGGPGYSPEVEALRAGRAEPSASFFTVQIGCRRNWEVADHHWLVLTPGSDRVYQELYLRKQWPSDPSIYVNTTSATDPTDAPPGGCNPFIVVGAPAIAPDQPPCSEFESQYADRLIERLEQAGLSGFSHAIQTRTITGPAQWEQRFLAYHGAIHGLSAKHNILGNGFRPLNFRPDLPGLYFVGGGVQPGPGMPMVVQSARIVANHIACNRPIRERRIITKPAPATTAPA